MRLNKEQLDKIKKQFNANRIWSFSRLSTWGNCPTEYYQKYYLHKKLSSDSVYTEWGTTSHNLVQDVIDKKILPGEAINVWKKAVKDWEADPTAFQFDTDRIKNGYINNLNNYFRHVLIPNGSDFRNEQPVLVRVGKDNKYVFVGYIDTQYTDADGNTVLIDYKTSSKSGFSGDKLQKKAMQLMLYAIGKHQMSGVPYDKIKARFDMMKYCRVHFKQENGKWKDTIQERSIWVAKIAKKLATKLKKLGYDEERANEMIETAKASNGLANMPEEIQEQFQVGNYFIELDISEENCQKVAKQVEELCDTIMDFENMDEFDQENWLELNARYDPTNYYETHLCSWHTSEEFKKLEGINEKKKPVAVSAGQTELDDLFGNDSLSIDALFG
ncbi:PD-(D/E)XK nuclease family protein [Limosilactobacillus ingluviei]|uniref:PD-(D/E)XK nuclease family protein n=1 Tax=Limosilactobacillus ingluviei TaxID=148604 RepID=UPI000704E86F|nr:PD-(D/E)XK nuclease family protein [Limosilactobacillus ingluviei]